MKVIQIVLLLCGNSLLAAELTPSEVQAAVELLDAKTTSFPVRKICVQKLQGAPIASLISSLVPFVSKPYPSDIGYNGTPDDTWPPEVQAFGLVQELWSNQVKFRPPSEEAGRVFVGILKTCSAQEKVMVADALDSHWVPEAEASLVAILTEPKDDPLAKYFSSLVLCRYTGKRHYPQVLEASTHIKARDKRVLMLDALMEFKQYMGIDPAVIKMGFELVLQEQAELKNNYSAGYFQARALGSYLEITFIPDQKLEKYKGKYGLAESFFQDTTSNALQWWNSKKDLLDGLYGTAFRQRNPLP